MTEESIAIARKLEPQHRRIIMAMHKDHQAPRHSFVSHGDAAYVRLIGLKLVDDAIMGTGKRRGWLTALGLAVAEDLAALYPIKARAAGGMT